ncbi:DUF6252 family protein [Flavobacterium luteum]|uniref:Uncharacterized protein n=1 Tax=Flavobacterium luteum TaxID=2026654 RepID=A0A7J5AF06_9FLAO|nr:DUF6252 family protein [Flavobacterium luteum]KAB1156177.1 hypothetical protein F6464_08235 [Flavobacterium luteum]
MNKCIYFLLFLIGLTSCNQDISINNTGVMQGVKDNVAWRATDARATVESANTISIEAVTINETLTLNIPLPSRFVSPSNKIDPYDLSKINNGDVTYSFSIDGVTTDYESDLDIDNPGVIAITEYDGQTISGTFRFNLKNTDDSSEEAKIVNFQYGNFYKVPVTP